MAKLTIELQDCDDKNTIMIYSIEDSIINSDLTICDFKDLSRKLAYTIGYHIDNVDDAFGDNDE